MDTTGKLELLILQPTPFCNLDCTYCYLPNRDDKRCMTVETLEATLWKVFHSGLLGSHLGIVWHAGEPLVLSPDYYEAAFALVDKHRRQDISITHHFQTNATLINDEWCTLLKRPNIRVGVSIDGPAWLHNTHRKNRRGGDTFKQTMRGIDKLRCADIPFHVICVISKESLDHADEIFDFFVELNPDMLCFNVEEIDGTNQTSSLMDSSVDERFRLFFQRIMDRFRYDQPPFRIREIDGVLTALRHPLFGIKQSNDQNEPFHMLSVAFDGGFSTFSPELLGLSHPIYGDFTLGNVMFDDICSQADDRRLERMLSDIHAGISECHNTCKYHSFCCGGSPANKLSELGTFAGTETMYCRLTQKAIVDTVLTALEHDMHNGNNSRWMTPKPIDKDCYV